MAKIIKRIRTSASELQHQFIKELLSLTTSGFGLVAALAWNELIKEIIGEYIKPIAGESSQLISLLIYALIVTILAVVITYSLTKISKKS